MKKIFISSDHAGFKLKESIKDYLKNKKVKFEDLGPEDDSSVDYPDYAHKVTKLSRLHNDANIITLGSRLRTKKNALKFVSIFLNTKFDGGRHLIRVKKI